MATPQWDTAVNYTLTIDSPYNQFVLELKGGQQNGEITDRSAVDLIQKSLRVLANNWSNPGHAGFKFRNDENGRTTDIQS